MNRYFAEFLGTMTLTLAVIISIAATQPVIPTPVIAALTVGLFVFTIGKISGSHINPAVTIGLFSIKQISMPEAAKYILAQLLGSMAALIVSQFFVSPQPIGNADTLAIGLAELIGTFFLGFGIAAVVYEKVPVKMAGFVIGGSLLLGIIIASAGSNGVLNPAVAAGIGSFSIMYVIGPIVGGILGMQVFKFLAKEPRLEIQP